MTCLKTFKTGFLDYLQIFYFTTLNLKDEIEKKIITVSLYFKLSNRSTHNNNNNNKKRVIIPLINIYKRFFFEKLITTSKKYYCFYSLRHYITILFINIFVFEFLNDDVKINF